MSLAVSCRCYVVQIHAMPRFLPASWTQQLAEFQVARLKLQSGIPKIDIDIEIEIEDATCHTCLPQRSPLLE